MDMTAIKFGARVDGYRAGDVVELPDDIAAEYVDGGVASLVADTPPPIVEVPVEPAADGSADYAAEVEEKPKRVTKPKD